ncbi:coatomer subunit gamma-like isoform X2 [Salvia hispanica]|uniref:coatomer subunit gamma-like isoform X2 n=1 Tax=Salvia hispanica TaxID=49212 RepID=UPI002009A429|nr:coatomer subunit gamma-like isoform X2 [Salvia hispanica]XP_047968267.1 coatomer subunit gamma-like isoform X2 [Salvia hispanica]
MFCRVKLQTILPSAVNVYRFQYVHLRRLFHLITRDLCPIADEVPLVTSSLLKDVNTGNVAYRANAIRLLRHITNDTSLSKVVKFLDEALCDDNPVLQIASLVCAINLLKRDPRMAITLNQVYHISTFYGKGKHVQFHDIYLNFVLAYHASLLGWGRWIYMLQEHADGTSIPSTVHSIKMSHVYIEHVSRCNFSGHSCWSSSPLVPFILARGIAQSYYVPDRFTRDKYIESCIHDKDEMVAIEGFRSLPRVVGMRNSDVKSAIDVMRLILHDSHRPVSRFSAVMALHKVGMVHNVVWTTPEDHIAIGLDLNVYTIHMEQVEHQDSEAEAEQASRVIKSRSCSYNMHDGDPEAEQLSQSFPV